jgi:hypothetical protein
MELLITAVRLSSEDFSTENWIDTIKCLASGGCHSDPSRSDMRTTLGVFVLLNLNFLQFWMIPIPVLVLSGRLSHMLDMRIVRIAPGIRRNK